MAETLVTLRNNYNWFISDQRVKDWWLVPSPVSVLILTAGYVIIVVWRGPHWMKHREPFKIKTAMIIYNLCMVVLSAYLTYELFITTVWRPRSEYSLICQKVDYGDHPLTLRLAGAIWTYYVAKLIEYFDTIFLVLRKEESQITFLHGYRHVGIAIGSWAVAAYAPGGETYFGPMVNSFVHVWVYLIVGLALSFQTEHWLWERCTTVMQVVQLFVILAKTGFTIVLGDCGFPPVIWITCIYILTMALLFCCQASNEKKTPEAKRAPKNKRRRQRRSKQTPS